MAEIVSLADAVRELVARRRHRRARGLHAPDPARRRARADPAGRRDLTLVRMTPDVVYDQLIGMGCARKLVFSWGGNPGVGSLHRLRDAVEHGWPRAARARGALARRDGGRLRRRRVEPAVRRAARLRGHRPARAHARRDRRRARSPARSSPRSRRTGRTSGSSTRSRPTGTGNVQLWGITGVQKETVLASARSIVTVEEIVDELEPRPGAVVLPSGSIDAVACVPGGAHPSYAHGYYERDNEFYVAWDAISRDRDTFTDVDARARARKTVHARDALERRRTADEMMAVAAARRLRDGDGLLRRHRPAERRREPRAAHARAGLRARLRERHDRREAAASCRSRSATASSPRPPTRSSRCPRCSPTGCRAAASTSASSAPRRSTGTAT